jgi:nickel transport protein
MKKIVITVVCLSLLWAQTATAHKVIVFAWVEEGIVHTESSFGSKRPAKDSLIVVKDAQGQVVVQGRTSDEGLFDFKVPENVSSDLHVVLEAGTGHKGSWTILKQELEPGTPDTQAATEAKKAAEQGPSAAKIAGGIGIILLLALLGRRFLKKSNRS